MQLVQIIISMAKIYLDHKYCKYLQFFGAIIVIELWILDREFP